MQNHCIILRCGPAKQWQHEMAHPGISHALRSEHSAVQTNAGPESTLLPLAAVAVELPLAVLADATGGGATGAHP